MMNLMQLTLTIVVFTNRVNNAMSTELETSARG
jgi:hypothetical protein